MCDYTLRWLLVRSIAFILLPVSIEKFGDFGKILRLVTLNWSMYIQFSPHRIPIAIRSELNEPF